jgi:hypothetical protein
MRTAAGERIFAWTTPQEGDERHLAAKKTSHTFDEISTLQLTVVCVCV